MISDSLQIKLQNQLVHLLAERALFIPESQSLVIADVHLGKAAHFRKAGIIIPPQAGVHKELSLFHHLLKKYPVRRVLFLGDLFHSEANNSLRHFLSFIDQYPGIQFLLIKGNHDILSPAYYERAHLQVHPETLTESPLIYSHEPLKEVPLGHWNIAGHLHPSTYLKGIAKQRLLLPCFHVEYPYFILPAFGSLTGSHPIAKGTATQFVTTGSTIYML